MSYLEKQFEELNKLYTAYTASTVHTDGERINYLNATFNKLNLMNKIVAMSANGIKAEDQIQTPNSSNESSGDNQPTNPEEEPKTQDNKSDTADSNKSTEENNAVDNKPSGEFEAINEFLGKTENLVKSLGSKIDENGNEVPLSEEDIANKNKKAADAEKFIDQYKNYTPTEIIAEQLKLWGIKPKLAGYKNLIMIPEMMEKYGSVLNMKSDINDILNTLADVCVSDKRRIIKNINNIIIKADFSKSEFIPVLSKITVTEEILIKEFMEFCID